MLSDEGDEDEDDTGRLSELIALAEAGLQAEEAEDDTGRLSELIALAEAGLQVELFYPRKKVIENTNTSIN